MNTLMSRTSIDWKFYVTLIATVAGVVVPIWLWLADQDARSIHVKQLSQTALQEGEVSRVAGLKITIDGKQLDNPYLTIAEISNDGSRPITISDFESPLEIRASEKVRIVRAQITEVHPTDLQPTLTSNGNNTIKLQPLLMNPNDSIKIAVLTTGELPKFTLRTRIAGISTIQLDEGVPNQTRLKNRAWIEVMIGLALFVNYASTLLSFFKDGILMPRWNLLLISITSCVGGLFLILFSDIDFFNFSTWQSVAIALTGVVIGVSINRYFGETKT